MKIVAQRDEIACPGKHASELVNGLAALLMVCLVAIPSFLIMESELI